MKKMNTELLVEVAISTALSLVLGMFRLFRMPQGGSVCLEMLPILFIAIRHGGRSGMLTGALVGVLQLMIDPYIIHPVQVIMDYPLPFAMLGLAGYWRTRPIVGACVGFLARLVVHVLSGVIFFASYAPEGMSPWIYSIIYNASFLIPELILSAIALELLVRKGGSIIGVKGNSQRSSNF